MARVIFEELKWNRNSQGVQKVLDIYLKTITKKVVSENLRFTFL